MKTPEELRKQIQVDKDAFEAKRLEYQNDQLGILVSKFEKSYGRKTYYKLYVHFIRDHSWEQLWEHCDEPLHVSQLANRFKESLEQAGWTVVSFKFRHQSFWRSASITIEIEPKL